MKIGYSLLVLLAILSICYSQGQGVKRGFNPGNQPGKNSPQLQLQYCLLSNCRTYYDSCRNDEKCFSLLRQCPPRSYQSMTECFQLSMNENKDLASLLGFYQCINDKCKNASTTDNQPDHSGHN